MLAAFRFLNGLVIASLTLGPAMIGDMFKQEERGAAMAALYMGPLLGPVAAPIIGGFFANAEGWRWTFWLISIAVAVVQIPSFIFMRETNTGRLQLRGSAGAQDGQREKKSRIITQAILRPLKFLLLSPVVLTLSIYVAVVYGYLYIILTTLTTTLESVYGFSEWSSGLSYLGLGMMYIVFLISDTDQVQVSAWWLGSSCVGLPRTLTSRKREHKLLQSTDYHQWSLEAF